MAAMIYSYDPTKITDGGKDQMRFELGDTVVETGALASPLCDQEYEAILKKHGANWKVAKFHCLSAIVQKLSFEVDTTVDGLHYSLSQRFERWKKMKDDAEKSLKAASSTPRVGNEASLMPHGGTPYFYNNMQANRRKF